MKFLLTFLMFFFWAHAPAQVPGRSSRTTNAVLDRKIPIQDTAGQTVAPLFNRIQAGVARGSTDAIVPLLAPTVSVAIGSGESGFVSASQAAAILSNYFGARKTSSFTFSRTQPLGDMPFATGSLTFAQKGTPGSAQVYVALSRVDSLWLISRFNIY